jgi:hypothetical protein
VTRRRRSITEFSRQGFEALEAQSEPFSVREVFDPIGQNPVASRCCRNALMIGSTRAILFARFKTEAEDGLPMPRGTSKPVLRSGDDALRAPQGVRSFSKQHELLGLKTLCASEPHRAHQATSITYGVFFWTLIPRFLNRVTARVT